MAQKTFSMAFFIDQFARDFFFAGQSFQLRLVLVNTSICHWNGESLMNVDEEVFEWR